MCFLHSVVILFYAYFVDMSDCDVTQFMPHDTAVLDLMRQLPGATPVLPLGRDHPRSCPVANWWYRPQILKATFSITRDKMCQISTKEDAISNNVLFLHFQ
jgi:hypothetical protein